MARGLAPLVQAGRDRPHARGSGAAAEPGAAPLRSPGESALGRAKAGIFSPCEPEALEDVIPLGPSNSSSAPRASTPLRPRFSLFGESVRLQRAKRLRLSLLSLPSPELERPGVWLSGLVRVVLPQRRVGLASSPRRGRR